MVNTNLYVVVDLNHQVAVKLSLQMFNIFILLVLYLFSSTANNTFIIAYLSIDEIHVFIINVHVDIPFVYVK